ncbi:MAG: hypothetical protein A2Y57_04155 [Candidatus Woykebacteria bacterium RBG_13_40_7b]|uniref:Uncharacterized protein n=1 Tax=Candidatus Woykebacteria bacterium RBG_13_40_7b TaxID=1802594 RepID=A0A1G1W9N4_9BACT|nr:MAG: hypothetical protein A2Y57_04155 [Candidatus Woykebacteria bacterium RBG_13_40_7b]
MDRLPRKEKKGVRILVAVLSWVIPLGLLVGAGFIGYQTLQANDVILVSKGERKTVDFCKQRPEVCEKAVKAYWEQSAK